MFDGKSNPKICPRSGQVVKQKKKNIFILLTPITGLLALIWFLIRVIPKPSRLEYPCQKAAFPIATSFLTWLFTLFGLTVIFKKARKYFTSHKSVTASFFLFITIGSLLVSFFYMKDDTRGFTILGSPNNPIGSGKGVFPGRVAWAHDPSAVKWNGSGNWWEDVANDQTKINTLVANAVMTVGGQSTTKDSWDAIFKKFNLRVNQESRGYSPGEKIAIKINENNTTSHSNNNNINASPHMILAVLTELIESVGVKQPDITIFDTSRFITDNIYKKCTAKYPNVKFVDNIGGNGRIKSQYKENAIPFSVTSKNVKGLATCMVEANYVIDMAILKGHTIQGVTLCGKNFFGTTSIKSDPFQNTHDFFGSNPGKYCTITDFLGHKDMGEKTLLFMIDMLYANSTVSGTPNKKWQLSPFNNSWPASVLVSMDGVAIDSVGLDFLNAEWPNIGNANNCDNYLHEAAQANNPPSGTFYDPEKDGKRCASLGAHEHWNNSTDKKYSRNLGKNDGIELIYKK